MSMYLVVAYVEGSLLPQSVTPAATMAEARRFAADEFKRGAASADPTEAMEALIALLSGDSAKATVNGFTVSIYKEWRRVG